MSVPDDLSKLHTIDAGALDLDQIAQVLRDDRVVLVRNVAAETADETIHRITAKLGLADNLELQAGFASSKGHRSNIGKYYMTVNARSDYQFIHPHSEGTSFAGMQLACFYCHENTTDGGETILMHADQTSPVWSRLKERTRRATTEKPLTPRDRARARGLYSVQLPEDTLQPTDEVVQQVPTEIPGLAVFDVLAPVRTTMCKILNRPLRVYWDSVASGDVSCAEKFAEMLRREGLLRIPQGGMSLEQLDIDASRRSWTSGFELSQLFTTKIVHKMSPGELVVQNNLSWTHAVSNWTPGSGVRRIAAAFA